jgi:hypothetical protein
MSYFVAAQPVWDLVRRRQSAWGYTDDEMAAFLELGHVVDARQWMGRPMAEQILRRLTQPAPPTAGTRSIQRRVALMEGAWAAETAPSQRAPAAAQEAS